MPTVTPEMFLRAVHRTGTIYVHSPALVALGLCTELGEFAANPSVDEAGDVLWHVALLCEQTGLARWSVLLEQADWNKHTGFVPGLHEILSDLDHVKKLLAGSARTDRSIAARGLARAAFYVAFLFPCEDAMRANIIKIAKRDPRALPAEVLDLLKEAGQ